MAPLDGHPQHLIPFGKPVLVSLNSQVFEAKRNFKFNTLNWSARKSLYININVRRTGRPPGWLPARAQDGPAGSGALRGAAQTNKQTNEQSNLFKCCQRRPLLFDGPRRAPLGADKRPSLIKTSLVVGATMSPIESNQLLWGAELNHRV